MGRNLSKLSSLRRSKGISQSTVAMEAGLTQGLISQVETRRLVVVGNQKRRLVEAYGVAGKEHDFFDPETGLAL